MQLERSLQCSVCVCVRVRVQLPELQSCCFHHSAVLPRPSQPERVRQPPRVAARSPAGGRRTACRTQQCSRGGAEKRLDGLQKSSHLSPRVEAQCVPRPRGGHQSRPTTATFRPLARSINQDLSMTRLGSEPASASGGRAKWPRGLPRSGPLLSTPIAWERSGWHHMLRHAQRRHWARHPSYAVLLWFPCHEAQRPQFFCAATNNKRCSLTCPPDVADRGVVATPALSVVPAKKAHHFWVSMYRRQARVKDALLSAQFPAPVTRKEERLPLPHAFRKTVHNIGRPHLRVTDARAPFNQIRSRNWPAHHQMINAFHDKPGFFLRHGVENTSRKSPLLQRHATANLGEARKWRDGPHVPFRAMMHRSESPTELRAK